MLAPYDWSDFQTLHAVGQTGSFVQAGEVLGVSHSHVARRLRALEQRLGRPLFVRHARGVRPTAFGDALLAITNDMARNAQAFQIAADPQTARANITVAAPDDMLDYILAPLAHGNGHPELRSASVKTVPEALRALTLLPIHPSQRPDIDFLLKLPNEVIPRGSDYDSDYTSRKSGSVRYYLCSCHNTQAASDLPRRVGVPRYLADFNYHSPIDLCSTITKIDEHYLYHSTGTLARLCERGHTLALLPHWLLSFHPGLKPLTNDTAYTIVLDLMMCYKTAVAGGNSTPIARQSLGAALSRFLGAGPRS